MPMPHRGVLAALIVATIVAGIMAFSSGHAHAAGTSNCVTTQSFIAEMNHGGMFTTPIPARNMPAALALMEAAKKQAPVDAAWYVESPKHVSGVTYAYAGCITGTLAVDVGLDHLFQFRGILLGEGL